MSRMIASEAPSGMGVVVVRLTCRLGQKTTTTVSPAKKEKKKKKKKPTGWLAGKTKAINTLKAGFNHIQRVNNEGI